jgi:hypothetical protein
MKKVAKATCLTISCEDEAECKAPILPVECLSCPSSLVMGPFLALFLDTTHFTFFYLVGSKIPLILGYFPFT